MASGPSWVSKELSSVLLNKSMCVGHSIMSDSATPWAVARQAPLSLGFSRQEHWGG